MPRYTQSRPQVRVSDSHIISTYELWSCLYILFGALYFAPPLFHMAQSIQRSSTSFRRSERLCGEVSATYGPWCACSVNWRSLSGSKLPLKTGMLPRKASCTWLQLCCLLPDGHCCFLPRLHAWHDMHKFGHNCTGYNSLVDASITWIFW